MAGGRRFARWWEEKVRRGRGLADWGFATVYPAHKRAPTPLFTPGVRRTAGAAVYGSRLPSPRSASRSLPARCSSSGAFGAKRCGDPVRAFFRFRGHHHYLPALRSAFDDILLVPRKQIQKLGVLRFAYAMFLQYIARVLKIGLPLFLRDAQANVRRLHVAANIEARSTRQRADLIDEKLPCAQMRIEAA